MFAFSNSDPAHFSIWLHNPQIKRSLIALAFHSAHITLRNQRIQFNMVKPDLLTVGEEVLQQLCNLASSAEQTFPYPPGVSVPLLFPQHKRIVAYLVIGALLAAIVYYLTL